MIPTPVAPGTEPAKQPRFASVITPNGPAGANNVIEPSEGKKDIGWNIGERPPREYMNWIHNITNTWVTYFKSWVTYLTDALPAVADNWAINPATTSGLTFGFKAGSVRMKTDFGSEVFAGTAAGTVSLTNNATNTVYFDISDGVVAVTTSYSAQRDRIALYTIVTSGGAITWASSFDLRTPHHLFTPSAYSGNGTTGYVPDPGSVSKRYLKDDGTFTRPTPDAQSPTNSDYGFVTADAWQVVTHTGAGTQNWTVPNNSTQAFKAGDIVFLSNEAGAGNINILAAGGVTISYHGDAGAGPWVLPGLGNMALLMKTGTNTWQFLVLPPTASAVTTVYSGYVGSDGTTNNSLPPGWTAARTGGGAYTITHNLGLATARDLSVIAIPFGTNSIAGRMESGSTTVNVAAITMYTTSSGSAADTAFVFIAKRNV